MRNALSLDALGLKGSGALRSGRSPGPVVYDTKRCPLCKDKMLKDDATELITVQYNTHRQPTKAHRECARKYDGGVIEE